MKFISASIFIACGLLQTVTSNAQWTKVYSNPHTELSEIQFTSEQVGYALGNYLDTNQALLLKTVNGGNTWTEIPLDIPFAHNIDFLNDSSGYVISGGAPGKILHSANGFSNWTTHDLLDNSFESLDIHATSDSTGFFLLNEGRLDYFSQYGQVSTSTDSLTQLNRFAPVSAPQCFMYSPTEIYKTNDGGANWTFINGFYSFIVDLAFSSPDTGYMVSANPLTWDRSIMKTTDGGLNFPTGYSFPAQHITVNGQAVAAINDTGNVAWSLDAGSTWSYEQTGTMPLSQCQLAITAGHRCFFTNSNEGAIYKRDPFLSSIAPLEPNSFSCYPNPAHRNLIFNTEKFEGTTYEVIDMSGRLVLTGKLNSPSFSLNISTLLPGTYLLKLRLDTGSERVAKFVKE